MENSKRFITFSVKDLEIEKLANKDSFNDTEINDTKEKQNESTT